MIENERKLLGRLWVLLAPEGEKGLRVDGTADSSQAMHT
jgi:hypothetical protein